MQPHIPPLTFLSSGARSTGGPPPRSGWTAIPNPWSEQGRQAKLAWMERCLDRDEPFIVAELDSSGSVLSVLSEGRHALVGSAVAEARRLITQHGGPCAYRDGVVASRVTDLFEHEAKALAAQLADLYFGTPNASSCHGSRL